MHLPIPDLIIFLLFTTATVLFGSSFISKNKNAGDYTKGGGKMLTSTTGMRGFSVCPFRWLRGWLPAILFLSIEVSAALRLIVFSRIGLVIGPGLMRLCVIWTDAIQGIILIAGRISTDVFPEEEIRKVNQPRM